MGVGRKYPSKKFYEKYELSENDSKQVQIDDQTVRLIRFTKPI